MEEKLKIDQKANEENIKIFKRYGIRESEERRHTCVLCGKKTNIDSSFSNNGSRLICWHCAYKNFKGEKSLIDIGKLMRWNHGEEENTISTNS